MTARHALYHYRAQRRLNAEVRRLGTEVQSLKRTVTDRLNRALTALADRDAWIYSDKTRARAWEKWRQEQATAAAETAKEKR